MREQGEKRTIHVLEEILAERQKRKNVVVALAQEEMEEPTAKREQNDLILSGFLPKIWYHRFAPNIILSLWDYKTLGVNSIIGVR